MSGQVDNLLDELDRRLIASLRADSRTPVATLAKALKVSRGTVQNRIDRLLARGVIRGFTIVTRPEMEANRVRAVMTIVIEGERSAAVVQALKGFPQIARIHTTNGRWDLVVELDVATLGEFSQTLDEIRRIEGIASTETSILLATL